MKLSNERILRDIPRLWKYQETATYQSQLCYCKEYS